MGRGSPTPIISTDFQSPHTRRSQTQNIRSAGVSFSRLGADRCKTASCCRKARFSNRRWAEVLNIEMSTLSTVSSCSAAEMKSKWKSINLNDCRSIRIFWRDSRQTGDHAPGHYRRAAKPLGSDLQSSLPTRTPRTVMSEDR